MDFTFSEDQLLFQESVRDFLVNEVTPERIRGSWETDSGRDPGLWQQLTELGLVGMTVPEEHGGLGMSELDFVLLAQECGYVALPEPLVHTALVAVPLLNGYRRRTRCPVVAPYCRRRGQSHCWACSKTCWWKMPMWRICCCCNRAMICCVDTAAGPACVTTNRWTPRKLYAVDCVADARPIASGSQAADLVEASLNRGALGAPPRHWAWPSA